MEVVVVVVTEKVENFFKRSVFRGVLDNNKSLLLLRLLLLPRQRGLIWRRL